MILRSKSQRPNVAVGGSIQQCSLQTSIIKMAPERLLSDPPELVSVEWPSSPVLEGSYVRLRCKGSANPTAELYAWYRSRLNPGTDQGPSERHAEGPLGFSRSINVSVSADAQYFCEVGNLYGAKNTSLTQMVVHCESTTMSHARLQNVSSYWVPST